MEHGLRMNQIGLYPYFTKNSTELKYFVDYSGSNGYLLVLSPKDFVFFTDVRYIEASRASLGEDRVVLLENMYTHPISSILDFFKKKHLSDIYINFGHFSYQEMIVLIKDTKEMGIIFKDIGQNIDKIRLKKDALELKNIRHSQEINEKAFAGAISLLKEGVSEQDIANEFEYLIKKQGASSTSFSTIILFGERTAYPHGVPGENKLKNGDIVLIDGGAYYNHYCSDMTRTMSFGQPKNTTFKEHYGLLLKAQKECLNLIRVGVEYAHLDLYVRQELKKHNLDQYFQHSLGHGVGIDIHEIPRIFHEKKGDFISAGNVFTVEPGLYLKGSYGIRIEDLICVHEYGKIEVLSQFPKELMII